MSLRIVHALMILGCLAPLAQAADNTFDTRLRDQLRQAILDQRKLQDENDALRAQLSSRPPVDAPQPQELGAAKGEARRARAEAEKAAQKAVRLEQQVAELGSQLGELQQAASAQAASLRGSQLAERQLSQKLAEAQGRISSCEQHNATLLSLDQELVARYKARGFFDVLLAREPFTGLKRVQLEKIAQDYEGRLREQKVRDPAVADGPR